jgi:P27 family predicted phage terminase small subunit
MKAKKTIPPTSISAEGKQLWQRIFDECELDAPGLLLLNTMCECFDRMRAAQQMITEDGAVLSEKTGAGVAKLRPHPACAILRDERAGMLRCWRLLGFDQAPPGSMGA